MGKEGGFGVVYTGGESVVVGFWETGESQNRNAFQSTFSTFVAGLIDSGCDVGNVLRLLLGEIQFCTVCDVCECNALRALMLGRECWIHSLHGCYDHLGSG